MNDTNLFTIKTQKDKKWTHLNLICIEDKQLSWKAKAIHIYMISRPPNWQIKSADLATRSTDGQVSLHSGINELISLNYIYRMVKRNDKRQIIQHGFVVLEEPSLEPPILDDNWEYKRGSDKLQMENLNIGDRPSIINNRITSEQEENNEHSFSKEKEEVFSQGEKADDPEEPVDQRILNAVKNVSRTRTIETPDAQFIVDILWNEQKLVQHRKGTKNYAELTRTIQKMLDGKFTFPADLAQYNGHKFKRRDFVKAIKQFALAAKDPDYEVSPTSSYKKKLQSTPFLTFIYNPYSTNETKSLFIKYLENDAQLLVEKGLEDSNPKLTEALITEYYNNQPNFKKEDANRATFVRVTNKLIKFFEENKSRTNTHLLPTDEKLAKWFVRLVFEGATGKVVLPHWLLNEYLFLETFPAFLLTQNVLIEKKVRAEAPEYKPADPRYHHPQADRYEE